LLWNAFVRRKTPEAEIFGRTLRRLREAAGLSQERVAQEADLTTGYISDLERGLKAPGLATIIRLATALGVSPSDMLKDFTPATLRKLR
jgi:transcriptional regulator with XRE-family HTH domain